MIEEEYIDRLKHENPPFKCVYNNYDYVATGKSDTEWTLTPCYKTTNNGKSIKVPIDTILTHVIPIRFE